MRTTRMTSQDDSNMITEEIAKGIRVLLRSHDAQIRLNRQYKEFVGKETNCGRDIDGILGLHQLMLINKAWKTLVIEAKGNIDQIDMEPILFESQTMLQNVFAMGMLYGRAIFEQQFIENMKLPSETDQKLMQLQTDLTELAIVSKLANSERSQEEFLITEDETDDPKKDDQKKDTDNKYDSDDDDDGDYGRDDDDDDFSIP